MTPSLKAETREIIDAIFARLDYAALAPIYCDDGGAAFWEDRRGPCQQLGRALAEVLLTRLPPGGRSLYVGAGVAELPLLVMEVVDLHRQVDAYNLRAGEVDVLNRTRPWLPCAIAAADARTATGTFDHLCLISVLNDPERWPEVSALSYGRANPATFDPDRFRRERDIVRELAAACLAKLARPALITTSVEEIPWITEWAERETVSVFVEPEDYPTAIVGDPVCFIRLGVDRGQNPTRRDAGPSRY